jgi:hypothetical protein
MSEGIAMFRTGRRRNAWTLLELLVVIGIMSLIVGLLLSAVAHVRAAASKADCANNLRQIGLAAHHYHETQRTFPPGMTLRHPKLKEDYLTWHARLLPFLEQDGLWLQTMQAFRRDANFLNRPPHDAAATVLRVFGCPADGRVRQPSRFGPALTSYLGVVGLNHGQTNGVLFRNSAVSLRDITDGASSTLLIGERPPNWDTELGWWYAGIGQDSLGSAEMYLGVREYMVYYKYYSVCRRGPHMFRSGNPDDPCSAFHFWSLHSGGAHFVLCDGAVRFIRYSANPVLPALATRAGGESDQVPD